jgi:hypothetical protein
MQMQSKNAQEFSHKYDHSMALNHTTTIRFDNFHYCVHGQ